MIAYLHGRLLIKRDNCLVLNVQGVGYEVFVSQSTLDAPVDLANEMSLLIYTHVREDALALYGFATPLERQLFVDLIKVSSVGPKLALAVLSGIRPDDLVVIIKKKDIAKLMAVPGVGKKTAERICHQ